MKVKIDRYRNHWLSPYTILEKVLFWKDWDNIDLDTPWVEIWAHRIHPFSVALHKFLDWVHPRIIKVKLDPWDTWNMDAILATIILPMLKQLKETKHGAPNVDDADVPEELRSTSAPPKENDWDTDDNHFKRWEWVMDEMIFAFECLQEGSDWEAQFHSGELDIQFVKCEDSNLNQMVHGPNHTHKFDREGYKKIDDRINNGLRLFGVYYRGLWD